MPRDGQWWVRRRWWLLALWAIAQWWVVADHTGDWGFFRTAAGLVFGGQTGVRHLPGGIHTWASDPSLQFGPPAVLFAEGARLTGGSARSAFAVLTMSLCLPTLWCIEATAIALGRSVSRAQTMTAAGGGPARLLLGSAGVRFEPPRRRPGPQRRSLRRLAGRHRPLVAGGPGHRHRCRRQALGRRCGAAAAAGSPREARPCAGPGVGSGGRVVVAVPARPEDAVRRCATTDLPADGAASRAGRRPAGAAVVGTVRPAARRRCRWCARRSS